MKSTSLYNIAARLRKFIRDSTDEPPPLRSPTAIELRRSRENGLLSPHLSSKGGEGEDREGTRVKCLNSTTVHPSPLPLGGGEGGSQRSAVYGFNDLALELFSIQ